MIHVDGKPLRSPRISSIVRLMLRHTRKIEQELNSRDPAAFDTIPVGLEVRVLIGSGAISLGIEEKFARVKLEVEEPEAVSA